MAASTNYLERAAPLGRTPFIAGLLKAGTAFKADAVVPTFTEPQQPLHRHRRAALGARHLRQLTSTTATPTPR
jgi:hypothetical protein